MIIHDSTFIKKSKLNVLIFVHFFIKNPIRHNIFFLTPYNQITMIEITLELLSLFPTNTFIKTLIISKIYINSQNIKIKNNIAIEKLQKKSIPLNK